MKRFLLCMILAHIFGSPLALAQNSGNPSLQKIIIGAKEQVGVTLSYDPAYTAMAFPMGDVPLSKGVCTDVVIRAFRKAEVDLQVLVHEDMKRNFAKYPKIWGLKVTDRNIDHRRVPNLMTFFNHKGKSQPISNDPQAYQPGDVVAWLLPNGLHHIGLVSDQKSSDGLRPLVVHNIGAGAQQEDILFAYKIIGHYRYF